MAPGTLTDSLAETLRLFGGSGEPRTTTEIAEELGLGRRSTYDRLERLVEQDRLRTKKVGANARVWWRPRGPSGDCAMPAPDWPAAAESLIDDVFDDVAVGVFVLDENFDVAWINETTERYFGLDRGEVLGRDKGELVAERIAPSVEDSTAFAETVLATYEDNTYTERFECHLLASDDRDERWLEHRSKPIESGEYAGGRVELYYDVTDRTESERRRRENRAELESLVEAVDEYAIVTLDPEGYVRTWNRGAQEVIGYEETDIVGEHVATFFTEAERAADVPERTIAEAAREGSIEVEGWRLRADGTRFWANVTLSAMRTEAGDLRGFAAVVRDMTERRGQEERLRREQRLTDEVLETAPVRIAVYDPDGHIERVNSRAREELGMEVGDQNCFEGLDVVDEDGDPRPIETGPVERVIETGEPVEDMIVRQETPDGTYWASLTASPLFDEGGDLERVIVVGNDITDLKRKERQLERQRDELEAELDDVFTRVDDAVYALDEDWQFTYVNEQAEVLLDTSAEELLGVSVWDAFPNAREGTYREQFERAMATQEPVVFEEYSNTIEGHIEVTAYPSENGLSVYFRDVSDRTERERELERYETIVETIWDGVYALDPDENFVMVNDAFLELTGYEREELLGEPGKTVHNERINEAAEQEAARVVRGDQEGAVLEFDLETKQGETIPVESRFGPYQYDDRYGRCGVVRDVSARKEYERYLEGAKDQLEAATEAGAVGTFEWYVQEDEMVAGPTFAKTFGIDSAEAREGVSLDRFVERIHEDDRERVERAIERALETGGAYEEEYRVKNVEGEYRWVVARGHVEHDADGEPERFPGALTDITARKRAELELEGQRRRLAALNNLNQVVREITDAIIEQSSREEIEATVCERLADSESYSFAWTGEVGPNSRTVDVRTQAGDEDYLDDVTITVDPDDPRSQGPTGRALRTGEVQVTKDIDADQRHDPWREHVDEYEYRSSAAIPIAHEDTVYGVLNVYADRPRAFTGEELDVIDQLGEIVGHAIAATERKRALMSDELVELGFHIEDVFDALDVDVDDDAGRISIDHTIALGSGEYLVYGTATEPAVSAVRALGDAVPHWEVGDVDESKRPATFEVRMSDPPVLSAVASLGGYVEEVVIEDGDYRMTLHLAPSVDVRQVIDAVEDAYPAAEMYRRRQISRTDADRDRRPEDLVADLTDRQRTALEAAFHSGFFEWPRDASGEEVADAIGVAAPTFHQHLRKAEGKVFEAILTHGAGQRGES